MLAKANVGKLMGNYSKIIADSQQKVREAQPEIGFGERFCRIEVTQNNKGNDVITFEDMGSVPLTGQVIAKIRKRISMLEYEVKDGSSKAVRKDYAKLFDEVSQQNELGLVTCEPKKAIFEISIEKMGLTLDGYLSEADFDVKRDDERGTARVELPYAAIGWSRWLDIAACMQEDVERCVQTTEEI